MLIPNHIEEIISILEANGFEAFVVGGCVRDTLLKKTPADWDICTSATPEEISEVFKDIYPLYFVGVAFGTVVAALPQGNVEITTYRKDGDYLNNRHPESVSYTTDIKDDLLRRDFTINAMAYSKLKGLIDLFDGQKHLNEKLLTCVGNPETRFTEDALRILRAIRFASVYEFNIHPDTASAIHKLKGGLLNISAERIWEELKKTLVAEGFPKIASEYADVFSVLFPEPKYGSFSFATLSGARWTSYLSILSKLPAVPSLRLSALLYWAKYKNPDLSDSTYITMVSSALHHLKADRQTMFRAMRLSECQLLNLPETLEETRRLVGKYTLSGLADFLAWQKALLSLPSQSRASSVILKKAENFLALIESKNLCCTINDLAISGDDLKEKGLESGPEIGQALRRALDAVIDEGLPNEKEVLLNFLFY